MNTLGPTLIGATGIWAILAITVVIVVHLAFALGVYEDAKALKEKPALVSPPIWGLATLVGGIITASIYWAMHHSILKREAR